MKPNTVILGWPYGWRQSEEDRTWRTFLETVRVISNARMALLVPKGINFFPESTEKVSDNRILALNLWAMACHGSASELIGDSLN